MPPRTTTATQGVLLANLGSPRAPTRAGVRAFLGEFLADPLVVTAHDDEEISVTRYRADGDYLMIWLAPEYGFRKAHRALAEHARRHGKYKSTVHTAGITHQSRTELLEALLECRDLVLDGCQLVCHAGDDLARPLASRYRATLCRTWALTHRPTSTLPKPRRQSSDLPNE